MALSFLYPVFLRIIRILCLQRSDDSYPATEAAILRHEVAVPPGEPPRLCRRASRLAPLRSFFDWPGKIPSGIPKDLGNTPGWVCVLAPRTSGPSCGITTSIKTVVGPATKSHGQ
jgi:hypothetical protein